MAAKGRQTDTCVEDNLLIHKPYSFNFFQAVRVLGKIYASRQKVGGDSLPGEEVVRFRGDHSLTFAPSSIHKLETNDRGQAEMTVSFMGLTGRQGVLPFHYSDLVLEGGEPAARFFDVFLHRLVSLFYRAWEKHSIMAQFEQELAGSFAESGINQYFFDLFGMGTDGLREQLSGIDSRALVYYSGLLAQRPHSASALETILSDYFQVSIKVEQFVGRWISFEETDLTDMRDDSSRNRLGEGASLGESVWNPQAGIRLQVGPLSWKLKQFQSFLPTGAALVKLISLTRIFLDWNLDFDIQLILHKSEVPDWKLSDEGPDALRLGLSTWLKTDDFQTDASDVILPGGVM